MPHPLAGNRTEAEKELRRLFGFEKFHDDQWEAVSRLLNGERVLMIERTGFGKSLCFQFPATQLEGVTVIFSPLIALMRDQVASLEEKGIPAACINSGNTPEQNKEILDKALNGELKILYIAPERQDNDLWNSAVYRMKIAMVVIDEAHTISVWGHDFRPSFRRIVGLVNLLSPGTPVLAVTATATPRVQADIERQIGSGLHTLRGNLLRDNFRFHVIKVVSEEEKYIWLARHIHFLKGSGIIYTGTRSDTDSYTRWLRESGVDAVEYNAGLDDDTRKEVEKGLMSSRWKCIVSTNALGMGIDKNDIRFIIHTQIPSSPVHYYQETGRAGRDGLPSDIILFYNPTRGRDGVAEDCRLPLSFINNARPSVETYRRVIETLKSELLGEREVIMKCNLKSTEFRIIKADLLEQGIIRELKVDGRKKYEYQYDAPALDTSDFEMLRRARLKDLDAMVEYVETREPRMKYLCQYLGDNTSRSFGGCDNTIELTWIVKHDARFSELESKLHAFVIGQCHVIKPSLGKNPSLTEGRGASAYRERGIKAELEKRRIDATFHFSEESVDRMVEAFRTLPAESPVPIGVVAVPSSGDAVTDLAMRVATRLGLPFFPIIKMDSARPPQRDMRSGYSKKDNVKGKFSATLPEPLKGQTLLLIDDYTDSRATLTEVAAMLRKEGVSSCVPLTLALTQPGDI